MKMELKSFYERDEWKALRYEVLKKFGWKCQACGASGSDGIVIHCDHIKPIKLFPDLALAIDNIQVLCSDCNLGKSWRHQDDFRPSEKARMVHPVFAELTTTEEQEDYRNRYKIRLWCKAARRLKTRLILTKPENKKKLSNDYQAIIQIISARAQRL